MSERRGGKRPQYGKKRVVGEQAKEVLESIQDDSVIMKMFRQYASELDTKHDRYERIVKVSRDITIESKRIIFLLHNTGTEIENKREQIFSEADIRLVQLLEKFKAIALELEDLDQYLYLRAYASGLEEYIEALSFYEYQKNGSISNVSDITSKFVFQVTKMDESLEMREITLLCPAVEILLGIGDFTGELMRKCINNLGSGNVDSCFKLCAFVREIYIGFLGLNWVGHNPITRKFHTLRDSLSKMELVCYNIKVRGSEVPKHMLVAAVTSPPDLDMDEGYY